MNKLQFRDLTTAESFPSAYGMDLLKKQSEYFIQNTLSTGNFENGYKNMPVGLPPLAENLPLSINSKPPKLLIGTYLKHHWRPLLLVLIIGGLGSYLYLHYKTKKDIQSKRSRIPKKTLSVLPKNQFKSI